MNEKLDFTLRDSHKPSKIADLTPNVQWTDEFTEINKV